MMGLEIQMWGIKKSRKLSPSLVPQFSAVDKDPVTICILSV